MTAGLSLASSLPKWATTDSFICDDDTLFCRRRSTIIPELELVQAFEIVTSSREGIRFEAAGEPYIFTPGAMDLRPAEALAALQELLALLDEERSA